MSRTALERTISGGSDIFTTRAWCYFNFSRISGLLSSLGYPGNTDRLIKRLASAGLTDKLGIPRSGEHARPEALSLFETLGFQESIWLETAYSEMVNKLTEHIKPVELARSWSKSMMKELALPGQLVFLNAGMYFGSLGNRLGIEHRSATYTKRGICASFEFNTWFVSTSSCLNTHFRGHRRVGVLLLVRSVEPDPELPKKPLHIIGTPVAMGIGFPIHSQSWQMTSFD